MGSVPGTTVGKRRIAPVPPRARALRVVFSPDPAALERVLPLDGTSWVIGRAGTGEGLIDDQRMSREHLRVAVDSGTGAYAVDDLESRNGTCAQGKIVDAPVFVAPNMVIEAGDTLFVVDEAPSPDRFPRASGGGPAAAETEIVGRSFAAEAWRASVGAIGRARGSVLLLGPTGAGKEVTARAVHQSSGRSGRFVAVNCAAIPPEIAEAELFGYRKGAFTGAADDRAGFFAESSGGTLFLDEIGDLPAPIQAKLLRVLEESVVQPLGGGPPKTVDLRVIAATQLDLTATGFRRDPLRAPRRLGPRPSGARGAACQRPADLRSLPAGRGHPGAEVHGGAGRGAAPPFLGVERPRAAPSCKAPCSPRRRRSGMGPRFVARRPTARDPRAKPGSERRADQRVDRSGAAQGIRQREPRGGIAGP